MCELHRGVCCRLGVKLTLRDFAKIGRRQARQAYTTQPFTIYLNRHAAACVGTCTEGYIGSHTATCKARKVERVAARASLCEVIAIEHHPAEVAQRELVVLIKQIVGKRGDGCQVATCRGFCGESRRGLLALGYKIVSILRIKVLFMLILARFIVPRYRTVSIKEQAAALAP